MSPDKLFAKALGSLEICVSGNNNSCGKLFSLLEPPMTLNERLKVASVIFYS